MTPAMRVANRLNARFRYAKPSDASGGKPLSSGVVMHQFDNFEARGKPWAPCDGSTRYACHANQFAGRMSAFIIFRDMKNRKDRVRVPLISYGGGVVVNPTIKLKCAYGDDGSTFRANGGCYDRWCDPHNVWSGGSPCGFGGANRVDHAWHSYNLDSMLRLYTQHSQPYQNPRFYSGYNELVYDASQWNTHLPDTVEAFFGLFTTNGFNPNGATATQHKNFLREYGVSADEVPLLDFDPSDWDHPFKVPGNEAMVFVDMAASTTVGAIEHGPRPEPPCPDWCTTWKCGTAAWCQDGNSPVPCKQGGGRNCIH